ncbi:MarC family protein [Psychromonas sp. CD1]|uniref:MarC family protein n=1 Tax=Psychromonas sp. CD1 TaxID=1979839 RepID=UPI000B9A3971|nr:MarC family protein [Psychromonas sp. CD1]
MDTSVYLHALTALFIIIDPIGSSLIFNSLSTMHEPRMRTIMAVKSILISASILILFGNYGEVLFSHLTININSLRVAGGLLLFHTSFQMITQNTKTTNSGTLEDISVFPMTIPLLAGPGALTLSLLLFSHSTQIESSIAVTLAIISILGLTLVLMLCSKFLKKIIGRTGDEILKRFFGVILAALAIQFIYDGINNLTS